MESMESNEGLFGLSAEVWAEIEAKAAAEEAARDAEIGAQIDAWVESGYAAHLDPFAGEDPRWDDENWVEARAEEAAHRAAVEAYGPAAYGEDTPF
jgi:hypothetical protein